MAKFFKYVDNTTGLDFEAESYESNDFVELGGAGSESKPIKTKASGLLDNSLLNIAAIDHDDLTGRDGIDGHTDFLDLAGTRAMSGSLNMNANAIIGLPSAPSAANEAVSKAYADALSVGNRTKGNVEAASVGNLVLSGEQTIDGIAVVAGDRILAKDQTDPKENGIYVVSAGAFVRSEDLDNDPQAEIMNGVLIPVVLDGTVNAGKPFFISSVGTGVDGMHIIGTDNIVFEIFTSPTQLQGGAGIEIDANVINVDLDANSSLSLAGNKLAIDFAAATTDEKPWKASDLTASYVPIVDAGAFTDETEVEGALQELYGLISANGVEYIVGTGGCAKGDLAQISAANTAIPYANIANSHRGIGLFLETKAVGETTKVLANDTVLAGVLSGATPGVPYYWNGTTFVSSIPNGSGAYVWQVGVAKNTTDLHVEVRFVKKNA